MNPNGKNEPVRTLGSAQIMSVTFQCDEMQMISATVVAQVNLAEIGGVYYEEIQNEPSLSYQSSVDGEFVKVQTKPRANGTEYSWENVGAGEFVAGTQYTFRVQFTYRRIVPNQSAFHDRVETAYCP